jgi:hypothetical protein
MSNLGDCSALGCRTGNHVTDLLVDGHRIEGDVAVYVFPVRATRPNQASVIPPAFRGSARRLPERDLESGQDVYVVLACDEDQERIVDERSLLQGEIVNRAVVHVIYEDGSIVSHFPTQARAERLARWMCDDE